MNSFLELFQPDMSYRPMQDKKLVIIASPISLFAASLCLIFTWLLLSFMRKVWWIPLHIQRQLRSQGIRGPSYSFLYGNAKEMMTMINSSKMITPADIFPRTQPHMYTWSKLHGRNFFYWLGPQPQLVIAEPALIKEILSNKEGEYVQQPVEGFVKKLLGDGLLSAEGEKWYKLRKLANHSFHSESLKGMIPAMILSTGIMLGEWGEKENQEVEVHHEFKKLTADVISRTAFGSSYLKGQYMFDLLTKMTAIVERNAFKIRIPGIGKFLKTKDDIESDNLDEGMKIIELTMIKEPEDSAMKGKADDYGNDFFGSLVKAYHHEDKDIKINLNDRVSQCKTFYLAGHETTSSLLTWTVLLLAIYPDWQERAREEVLEVFGAQNPTADGIGKLKIALCASPFNSTTDEKRSQATEHSIPAKVDIIIPQLAMHRSTEIWGSDVHVFKPERFAQGIAKATTPSDNNYNSVSFFPFSFGPRTCVGMSFAVTEAKIALSMIIMKYSLKPSPSYVHCPVSLLTSYPGRGVQVMLQKL